MLIVGQVMLSKGWYFPARLEKGDKAKDAPQGQERGLVRAPHGLELEENEKLKIRGQGYLCSKITKQESTRIFSCCMLHFNYFAINFFDARFCWF